MRRSPANALSLVLAFVVLVSACGGDDYRLSLSDEQRESVKIDGWNQTGRTDLDTADWFEIVRAACESDPDSTEVRSSLVAEWGLDERVSADDAAQSLWLIAIQVCRERYPEEHQLAADHPSPATADARDPQLKWTRHPVPDDFRVYSIQRVGERLFGLTLDQIESPDARTLLWVSDDGVGWDAVEVNASRFGMRAGYFRDIAQARDRYVAVLKGEPLSPGGSDIVLLTSSDGRTWDPVDIGASYAEAVAGDDSGAIALTRSLADFRSQSVWYSSDGMNWQEQPPSVDSLLHSPVMVNGVFYAVTEGDAGELGLYASAHGADWIQVELPDAVEPRTVLYLGEALGTLAVLVFRSHLPGGSGLWIKPRGSDWVDITPPEFEIAPTSQSTPVATSNLATTFIVDPGFEHRTQPAQGTVWVVGDPWLRVALDQVVGAGGHVLVAAALDHRIVLVYQEWAGGPISLWEGDLDS